MPQTARARSLRVLRPCLLAGLAILASSSVHAIEGAFGWRFDAPIAVDQLGARTARMPGASILDADPDLALDSRVHDARGAGTT